MIVLNLLFILFILSLYFIIKRLYQLHIYWDNRSVAHDRYYYLKGLYHSMFSNKTFGKVTKESYDKYRNERFVGETRFLSPHVILNDLEDIQDVLIRDFNYFKNRDNVLTDDDIDNNDNMSANLFHMNDEQWTVTRKKLTPVFTSSKLRNMFYILEDIANKFDKYLEKYTEKDVEVVEIMAKFTTDTIGACAFGINTNAVCEEESLFSKYGKQIVTFDNAKKLKTIFRFCFPKLYNYLGLIVISQEEKNFFQTTIRKVIEEKEKNAVKRDDFIDLLLDLKNSNNTEMSKYVKIDENFISSQAFLFFIGGFDTSSNMQAFTLYQLCLNPDIQDKVYKEIKTVLNKYDDKLTYEGIQEMVYLNMVLEETMRMYTTGAVLIRSCSMPYAFQDSKLRLKVGDTVAIPVLAIHYDPKYYPEPKKFIPERFEAKAKKERHPMTFLPFGEGPRNCIALRFAKLQTKVGLITLLKNFYVEPCSRTQTKIEYLKMAVATTSRGGIWLRLKKRNN